MLDQVGAQRMSFYNQCVCLLWKQNYASFLTMLAYYQGIALFCLLTGQIVDKLTSVCFIAYS